MAKKFFFRITLPESLSNIPVRIVKSPDCKEIVCNILPSDADGIDAGQEKVKYAFIWRQHDYVKVALDEILYIKAANAYSIIHLTGDRKMTVSFNLSTVAASLPESDFVRIHRSTLVNIRHVELQVGNSLKVGGERLVIGREYREDFFRHVIYIGVRRRKGGK